MLVTLSSITWIPSYRVATALSSLYPACSATQQVTYRSYATTSPRDLNQDYESTYQTEVPWDSPPISFQTRLCSTRSLETSLPLPWLSTPGKRKCYPISSTNPYLLQRDFSPATQLYLLTEISIYYIHYSNYIKAFSKAARPSST